MKKFFKMKGFIRFIAIALIFSLTILSTNTNVQAASSTATVTHIEVSAYGEEIRTMHRETYSYPIGGDFQNYMTIFDDYVISGISSSKSSINGVERVVASVRWQKIEITEEERAEEIPYETIEKEDITLDKGEKVVDQVGEVGLKTVTYEVTTRGGVVISRVILSEVVTAEPVDEIVRVGAKVTEVKEEQEIEVIPYETIEQEDPTLDTGKREVGTVGVAGEKTITYKVTYVNGEEENREVVREEVTVEPVNEIILVGTKVTEIKTEQETVEVPYETEFREDPELYVGEENVDQLGVNGEKIVTYEVTFVNGEEVSREVIQEEVTIEPVIEITYFGTKDLIEIKEEKVNEPIPYETTKVEDPDLELGKEVVDQEGLAGEKVVTYEVTYINGKETERQNILEEVITEPTGEIIRVGTKVDEPIVNDEESDVDETIENEQATNEKPESSEVEKESTQNEKSKDESSEVASKADNNDDGNKLPKTATSTFTWMAGGFLTLILGLFGVLMARRKESKI